MKVLHVLPCEEGEVSKFIFSRNQIKMLNASSSDLHEKFFFSSRKPSMALVRLMLTYVKESKKADIIHIHYGSFVGLFCSLFSRKKILINFRGSDLNYVKHQGLRSLFTTILTNLSVLFSDVIVCSSDRLAANIWWQKKKKQVISSGVNNEIFYPREKTELKKELNFEDKKLLFFYCGYNPLLKGLSFVTSVFEDLKKIDPCYHLICIKSNKPQEEIAELISVSDVVLLASTNEGSPNIIKEAMFCNTPFVATNVGDISLHLSSCPEAGVMIEGRDRTRFVKEVEKIVNEGREIDTHYYSSKFSLKNTSLNYKRIYDRLHQS